MDPNYGEAIAGAAIDTWLGIFGVSALVLWGLWRAMGMSESSCHKDEEVTLSSIEELLVDGKEQCLICGQTYIKRVFPTEIDYQGWCTGTEIDWIPDYD